MKTAASSSTPKPTPASPNSSGAELSVLDFQGVARVIDAVLEAAPERLPLLLETLKSSCACLEARAVLDLVVSCRDPLAPLRSLCRDALQAAADLDAMLKITTLKGFLTMSPPRRANAILNLCEATLSQVDLEGIERRLGIRRVRPSVKEAAVVEMDRRQDEIERIRESRQAVLPNLWEILEAHLSKERSLEKALLWRRC